MNNCYIFEGYLQFLEEIPTTESYQNTNASYFLLSWGCCFLMYPEDFCFVFCFVLKCSRLLVKLLNLEILLLLNYDSIQT